MTTETEEAPPARAVLRDPVTWIAVVAMLFVAVSAFVHARLYRYNVIDDSYISFQYAKNLATGHGVVFNPGERVEGYTNFLWVVLLAPFYLFAKAASLDFTRVALVVNAAVALGCIATMAALARRIFEGRIAPALVWIALTALDAAFQGYAVSGMENHLFSLFTLLALYAHEAATKRRALAIGAALAGVCLTRPDGVLFVLAWGVYALSRLAHHDERDARDEEEDDDGRAGRASLVARLREPVAIGLVFTAIFGAYFAWRFTYYGALLPNTFYLKVGDTFSAVPRGVEYTRTFIVDRMYLPILALGAVAFLKRRLVVWLLAYLVVHVAYVIYVGGDFYTGHRYFVSLLPVLYLAIAIFVDGVAESDWVLDRLPDGTWRGQPLAAAAAVGLFWIALFTHRGYERGPYTREVLRFADKVDNNVRYMRWLARPGVAGESMIVGDIGAAGFFADLRVIDVYGVVDPVVAHKKPTGFGTGKPGHEKMADRAYMLAKNPKFMKWGYIGGSAFPGYYLFTDFPPSLDVPGLWVREDLVGGEVVPGTEMHFDPGSTVDWVKEGDAFEATPSPARMPGQGGVVGAQGSFVNSYARGAGDAAKGRMFSNDFELLGDLMVLRVGGGRDPEKLRVSLLVDGQRVFSATGHNEEILGRRVWKIGDHRGKKARIEIVDASDAARGHILVDEIFQWRRLPGQPMPQYFQ
jgi:arabinofuranosyltransferase